MTITDAQVERFRTLYLQSFGIELSYDQAQVMGLGLLNLVHHIYQPITQKQLEAVQQRQKINY